MTVNSWEAKLKEFKEYVKRITHYNEAIGLMYWDLRTGAPKKGMAQRSEVIGTLSGEVFKMTTSEQMEEYIQYLSQPEVEEKLDDISRTMIKECRKEYERSKKIPQEKYQEYIILTSNSENAWEEAKEQSNFDLFRPYLEKVIAFNQEFSEIWGYEGNRYNALLEYYEPGMTVEKLDVIFSQLKDNIVPLLKEIMDSPNRPETGFLQQPFDIEKQKKMIRLVLESIGFDFSGGRIDQSVHPFCTSLNYGDVRVTTKFYENDLTMGLFSSIHEGGHALYEQSISRDLVGTLLGTGTSMGIHESQSRFWENVVGRSLPFWKFFYPNLVQLFPTPFNEVNVEEFYRAINEVKPSMIRIEADELTYNLHIIMRYELEKALLNNEIQVKDLPVLWNDKMREYLGIVPENDSEGVLQDVHWSAGLIGYFPSYTLGNIYAAQFLQTMKKELENYEDLIASGQFNPLKIWLTQNIYRHGKMLTPSEILLQATGEEADASCFINYLNEKFRGIYQI
ncbi:carboxypeptidase M32 [Microaerobacter geothermalis]|uniref:carboxypeptidase M32 n=1 Tax=Microaerobacter geothermalis TaxID=674972 RepID=UPI001F308860|nr:carboxypeptidase M32 [Microaerobacter geothermalis]MCF6093635.1 carboxypeptidase M32 [Microaerobacter geothermalis]